MKGPEKERRSQELETKLEDFHKNSIPLEGIAPPENLLSFVAQLIDSIHRIEYVQTLRKRPISRVRTDPKSELFDPIRASILLSHDQPEEACWLIFLATHSGRHIRSGWQLARELYGAKNDRPWTWELVSHNPAGYCDWLDEKGKFFLGKFGNHRKYESLKPGPVGTSAVVRSYVRWVEDYGSHQQLFNRVYEQALGDQQKAFRLLYDDMRGKVKRFGRTGRFDYLTMLAKVGIACIRADSAYIDGATGPKKGARLLFDGRIDSKTPARKLEAKLATLDNHLGVGMQVLEDALCNWQKSPGHYKAFRG